MTSLILAGFLALYFLVAGLTDNRADRDPRRQPRASKASSEVRREDTKEAP